MRPLTDFWLHWTRTLQPETTTRYCLVSGVTDHRLRPSIGQIHDHVPATPWQPASASRTNVRARFRPVAKTTANPMCDFLRIRAGGWRDCGEGGSTRIRNVGQLRHPGLDTSSTPHQNVRITCNLGIRRAQGRAAHSRAHARCHRTSAS